MTSRDSFTCIVWLPLVTIVTMCGVFGVPPPPLADTHFPLTEMHTENLEEGIHHRVKRAEINTTAYKYYWVSQCGYTKEKPANMPALEVAATHKTSDAGHLLGAKLIYRMTRFMPLYFFKPLAETGSVGIFSKTEVVGDFPEFARTKNSEACGTSCSDSCRRTCTADGRKIDSLLGYGGTRAVVREDNLRCLSSDPYRGTFNVLSHEFAHTINFRALNGTHNLIIRQSFSTAGDKWRPNTYATSNRREYFAEAVTSYFLTSMTSPSTSGGMNYCGNVFCTDEWGSRNNLKEKDQDIYDLVDEIFTNHRVYLEGRVGICNWR